MPHVSDAVPEITGMRKALLWLRHKCLQATRAHENWWCQFSWHLMFTLYDCSNTEESQGLAHSSSVLYLQTHWGSLLLQSFGGSLYRSAHSSPSDPCFSACLTDVSLASVLFFTLSLPQPGFKVPSHARQPWKEWILCKRKLTFHTALANVSESLTS